jgi:hypothetical protein
MYTAQYKTIIPAASIGTILLDHTMLMNYTLIRRFWLAHNISVLRDKINQTLDNSRKRELRARRLILW